MAKEGRKGSADPTVPAKWGIKAGKGRHHVWEMYFSATIGQGTGETTEGEESIQEKNISCRFGRH